MHTVIVGVCVVEDGKILMVKEGQGSVYGLWNFPAGHLDPKENIMAGAIREAKEETGLDVELTGLLSIRNYTKKDDEIVRISFMAKRVSGEVNYNKDEILDVQWIPIEKVEGMTEKELRGLELNKAILSDVKANNVYPLEAIKNMVFEKKKE